MCELVIDLRELDFLDSTGLRLLLQLHSDCRRDGCSLGLVPGGRAIRKLFAVTGTDAHFAFVAPPDGEVPRAMQRQVDRVAAALRPGDTAVHVAPEVRCPRRG